jgi:hypothetical protein
MNPELQKQIEAVGELDILGSFVWWSLRDVCVSRNDLETEFDQKGYPKDWLIPKPSFDSAFSKAIAKSNRNRKDLSESYIFRPILKNDEKIVFGIIKEEVDKEIEELDYQQITKVVLDRKSGLLLLPPNSELQELNQKLIDDYTSACSNLDSYDLSKQIRLILDKLNCLHVRDRGGVYFVLNDSKNKLNDLKNIFNFCKAGEFYILPQVNLAQTVNAIIKVFMENVVDDLKSFVDNVSSWENKKVYTNTVDATFDNLNNFKDKLKIYSRVLKVDVSMANEPITEIENKIHNFYTRKIKVK